MRKKGKALNNTSISEPNQPNPNTDELVKITLLAPASLRKAVKLKAAQQDRSIKEVLCELMENYVKDDTE